jgi:hypothetical protein
VVGSHNVVYHPQPLNAVAAPDGTFSLPDLCKGVYELEYSAPGKAILEREAIIKPDGNTAVTMKITLDQGDAIRGRVRDEAGKPLRGATVTPLHRHHDPSNPEVWTTGQTPRPTLTDSNGEFHFDRLYTGSFTMEVSAPGYTKVTLERIPAGGKILEVTLKRSKP